MMLPFLLALSFQGPAAPSWQQHVQYTITARLDEPTGVLAGSEQVVYVNRSPDTLRAFYLHLYLNAFRPGSKWSATDSAEGRDRFQHLTDPDFGFNHVRDVRIDGRSVTAEYPYAPDSTIVRFRLPRPLAPGDSLVASMAWDARPSTLARRQGRDGRRFDFAQWYPRVVAYDRYGWEDNPLQPAGEFYGEFGTFDVLLDVREDQVIGATGVPVEGDPGWERARRDNNPIDYQRDWYARQDGRTAGRQEDTSAVLPSSRPAVRCGEVGPGRKCVHFHAEDVHHFAMSLNPDYRYESGRYGDVAVHVLYQPGDEATWGGGQVVQHEIEALHWLHDLFGPYPWPQITNVHRIEGGGTEFPMMVMNGGPSLGLILHETGHNYLMGILANNEWKEGWLDEGFTSFQTTWYNEEHGLDRGSYYRDEAEILFLDLDGWSQPVSTPGHEFRDYNTYSVMTYTKGELFYHQLRTIVGRDVMRRILREYYRRYALHHVGEREFLETAEDVSHMELKRFFAQWLHETPLYDYAMGPVHRHQLPDGTWETTVEVRQKGDGWFPVEIGEQGNATRPTVLYARADREDRIQRVTFHSAARPGRLMLDPRLVSHDWNYLNNRESTFLTGRTAETYRLDTWTSEPASRDRLVTSVSPAVWYNDAAGVTLAARARSNYLSRFNRTTLWVQRGIDSVAVTRGKLFDFAATLENPTWARAPRTSQRLSVWSREGTGGVEASMTREHPRSWNRGDTWRSTWGVRWVATPELAFLDASRWEDGGTVELQHRLTWDLPDGAAHQRLDLDLGGGITYAARSLTAIRLSERYDAEPFLRAEGSASTRFPGAGFLIGARLYGGAYLAESAPLRQRRIMVAGADPYRTLGNPFTRSVGALFVRPDVYYHEPGGANLRGFNGALGGVWAAAANLEVERPVVSRRRGVIRRIGIVAFGDLAAVDADATGSGADPDVLWDAGAGLRAALHIGQLDVPVRLELPLLVSDPLLAQDTHPANRLGFRWLFSLEQSF